MSILVFGVFLVVCEVIATFVAMAICLWLMTKPKISAWFMKKTMDVTVNLIGAYELEDGNDEKEEEMTPEEIAEEAWKMV